MADSLKVLRAILAAYGVAWATWKPSHRQSFEVQVVPLQPELPRVVAIALTNGTRISTPIYKLHNIRAPECLPLTLDQLEDLKQHLSDATNRVPWKQLPMPGNTVKAAVLNLIEEVRQEHLK